MYKILFKLKLFLYACTIFCTYVQKFCTRVQKFCTRVQKFVPKINCTKNRKVQNFRLKILMLKESLILNKLKFLLL